MQRRFDSGAGLLRLTRGSQVGLNGTRKQERDEALWLPEDEESLAYGPDPTRQRLDASLSSEDEGSAWQRPEDLVLPDA
jgi:hypothetical protein